MATLFKQVYTERTMATGQVFVDTIWIEKKYCEEGQYIKRKIDGEWQDGWRVCKVFDGEKTQEQVIADRDRHKDHRKGTDI